MTSLDAIDDNSVNKWHINWLETWANDASRQEISALSETSVDRLREMLGVFG